MNIIYVDPCFNEGETLGGLSRGDADFVMVIHSNSGALGKREPLGNFLLFFGMNRKCNYILMYIFR